MPGCGDACRLTSINVFRVGLLANSCEPAESMSMTTGVLALVVFAAILAQVVVLASIGLYRRRALRDRDVRRPSPMRPSAVGQPSPAHPASRRGRAWEGVREFVVERRVFENADRSVCSFYLRPSDGHPLPPYEPGQYLTFELMIEEPATQERRKVVRCYSLSDRPRPDYYRVSIKRVPPPAESPDAPHGLASSHFHDRVQEGTRLMIRAPSGHFYLLDDEGLPVVLVAGGIGITPMLSIVESLMEAGSAPDVWLFYGVRNEMEQIMAERLDALAREHANLHLRVCYSQPRKGDLEKHAYAYRGRIDVGLLRATLPLRRHRFYVCGPRAMMESVVPGLEAWGVDASDVLYESFGPASLAGARSEEPTVEIESARAITVTFSRTGTSVTWDPRADSLLELAENAGIDVDSGCRAGSCGSCQTVLEAGEVEYRQRPDADIAPGHCLLCISVPRGDVCLAA